MTKQNIAVFSAKTTHSTIHCHCTCLGEPTHMVQIHSLWFLQHPHATARCRSTVQTILLTDMYQEPKHLLNDEHVISGSGEYLVARNSPISPQFLTSVQDQADGSPTPASPPAILDHPILQTLLTMPTMDPTMEGQLTVDAPMTQVGQKWKAWDLQSILVVWTCGQAVSESEISQNANVIKCKHAGCEMGWVSQIILFKDAKPTYGLSSTIYSVFSLNTASMGGCVRPVKQVGVVNSMWGRNGVSNDMDYCLIW